MHLRKFAVSVSLKCDGRSKHLIVKFTKITNGQNSVQHVSVRVFVCARGYLDLVEGWIMGSVTEQHATL